jgi:hypothetical protein
VTPEQVDGNFIAVLLFLGVVMDLTAVDSVLLFGIRLAVKDVLLLELDTFRAATRTMFWASRMVVVGLDNKDQRLVFQIKDRLQIAPFQLNGSGIPLIR